MCLFLRKGLDLSVATSLVLTQTRSITKKNKSSETCLSLERLTVGHQSKATKTLAKSDRINLPQIIKNLRQPCLLDPFSDAKIDRQS